jgi:hypothetical protein
MRGDMTINYDDSYSRQASVVTKYLPTTMTTASLRATALHSRRELVNAGGEMMMTQQQQPSLVWGGADFI